MQLNCQGITNDQAARAFVMLNATVCEPDSENEQRGFYDPESQTWVGQIQYGAGTYSSRSNGSRGGYSHQSDD